MIPPNLYPQCTGLSHTTQLICSGAGQSAATRVVHGSLTRAGAAAVDGFEASGAGGATAGTGGGAGGTDGTQGARRPGGGATPTTLETGRDMWGQRSVVMVKW